MKDLFHRNRLLGSLSCAALTRLFPSMQQVHLRSGQALDPGASRVFFPLTALLTLQQETPDGESVQVAMVGREGFAGAWMTSTLAGAPLRSRVLVAGSALAVDSDVVAAEVGRGGTMMRAVLRHGQSLLLQLSQAALCNRHHSIEQQLARWLLTSTDRLGIDDVEVTQELVAGLLGVRREGVSEAAGRLRDAGLIACRRGRFTVLHRQALRLRACPCYTVLQQYQHPHEHRPLPDVRAEPAALLREAASCP